jgi:hypothetical protein
MSSHADDVFGAEYADSEQELFWANGPLFEAQDSLANALLGVNLKPAVSLMEATEFKLGDESDFKPATGAIDCIDAFSNAEGNYRCVSLCGEFGNGRVLIIGTQVSIYGVVSLFVWLVWFGRSVGLFVCLFGFVYLLNVICCFLCLFLCPRRTPRGLRPLLQGTGLVCRRLVCTKEVNGQCAFDDFITFSSPG